MKSNSKALISVVILVFVSFIAWLWFWRVPWSGFFEYTTKTTVEREKKDLQGKSIKFTEETQAGKTLWDWLQLAGIPFVLAGGGYLLSQREQERAAENLREESLQTYFDRISELLLEHNLSQSDENNHQARDVARARTLTVLSRLDNDGQRKAAIVRFLHEAELIKKEVPIINLRGADLRGADFSYDNVIYSKSPSEVGLNEANISQANLNGANFNGANLSDANLKGANLIGAILSDARLSRANLNGANLSDANLKEANLSEADLSSTNLSRANLIGSFLIKADLHGSNLSEAKLNGAILNGANLSSAGLSSADLSSADLSRADFSRADLNGANLSEADLSWASLSKAKNLIKEQLKQAKL